MQFSKINLNPFCCQGKDINKKSNESKLNKNNRNNKEK